MTSTVSLPPTIIETLPTDGDVNISVDEPIFVTFSEPMDSLSLQVNRIPNPGGQGVEWNDAHTVFTLTHAAFDYSQAYTVSVEAKDQSGMPLQSGEVPNPWSFTTEMGPAPYILATSPVAGQDSTSPIKISCLISRDDVERAVRSLHAAFSLGDSSPA